MNISKRIKCLETDRKVVITGFSAVLNRDSIADVYESEPFNHTETKISRKLLRYATPGSLYAAEAGERAMKMADFSVTDGESNLGIYTNQNGYQHPDYLDLAPALDKIESAKIYQEGMSTLWSSPLVNPFLVTHALSNNMLGLLSIHWGVRGDCGAFIRDQAGAGSALKEALFSLANGDCDTALVASGGSYGDRINECGINLKKWCIPPDTPLEVGACSLIVESKDRADARGVKSIAHVKMSTNLLATDSSFIEYLSELFDDYNPTAVIYEVNPSCTNSALLEESILAQFSGKRLVNLNRRSSKKGCEGVILGVAVGASLLSKRDVRSEENIVVISCSEDQQAFVAVLN